MTVLNSGGIRKSIVDINCTSGDEFYERLVELFISNNLFIQMMPGAHLLGVFLYSRSRQRIVYGNDDFLKSYKLKAHHLKHPAIRRYVYTRLHPQDAKAIRALEYQAQKTELHSFHNKVVRIRQADRTYKSYHFLIFNMAVIASAYEDFSIGIQIDVSTFSDSSSLFSDDLMQYRRKIEDLSKREREILKQIVKGYTDKEVAQQLHISAYTAQKHRKNILKKLQAPNSASLGYWAGKSNII